MSQNTIVEPAGVTVIVARSADASTDKSEAPSVRLVISARSEVVNIAEVLQQIPPGVREVDERSSDAAVITARWCRPDLRVIARRGVGKHDALRAGLLGITSDVILITERAVRSHRPGFRRHQGTTP